MAKTPSPDARVLLARYTSPTALALAKAALESVSVPFEVHGETLVTSATIYGFFAAELWVRAADEAHARRALEVPSEANARAEGTPDAAPWTCATCGEENPASFCSCWSCGAEPHVGA